MKKNLTWSDIENCLKNKSKEIEKIKFDKVIALARGGLPIASLAQYYWNFRNFIPVDVNFYKNDSTKPNENLSQPDIKNKINLYELYKLQNKNILIIDDIVDTGITIKTIEKYFKKYTNCNLFYFSIVKNKLINRKDIIYCFEKEDEWIVFPWERS